ncbi:UNVERIFIED_CONTAM: Polyprotein P3 [Sesamum radiatum]|uniref:Polyprotein P3 n=1 Tax=Sesamum radiatum TaxID=300843 RepID=A0AAW2NNX3_SESRA
MAKLISENVTGGNYLTQHEPSPPLYCWLRKKDGSWQFCADYRGLNIITICDRFPIPTVGELLDELHEATVFSKLDLRAGYHQIPVAPEDIYKTAFRTVDGYFEFLVMPFGLTNAPSAFQAIINNMFHPIFRRFVLVFFDNILVYNPSSPSHLQRLTTILQVLQSNSLYAKLPKCCFSVPSVDYLGHVIFEVGVSID